MGIIEVYKYLCPLSVYGTSSSPSNLQGIDSSQRLKVLKEWEGSVLYISNFTYLDKTQKR